MNAEQRATVERLIAHYEANPPRGWMFDQCVSGVLGFSWRLVADAMGITPDEANLLVFKGYSGGTPEGYAFVPAYKYIVPSLRNLLETGKFTWMVPGFGGGPKN